MRRSIIKKWFDFFTFPIRALILFHKDCFGLSCLATERFDFVSREVDGYCLDVGCGFGNRFIKEFLNNDGIGIDVYKYDGLNDDNIVQDMTKLPFEDSQFSTITFIANVNHIPKNDRDAELFQAYRCLKKGGKIIITMGNPVAEILVHKVVWLKDLILRTRDDMDSERGMHEDEEYYLSDSEIISRLKATGFKRIRRKYFWTQWFFNHMFIAYKN